MARGSNSRSVDRFTNLCHHTPFLTVTVTVFLLSLTKVPKATKFVNGLGVFVNTLIPDRKRCMLMSVVVTAAIISCFCCFNMVIRVFFEPTNSAKGIGVPTTLATIVNVDLTTAVLFKITPGVTFSFLRNGFGRFASFFRWNGVTL